MKIKNEYQITFGHKDSLQALRIVDVADNIISLISTLKNATWEIERISQIEKIKSLIFNNDGSPFGEFIEIDLDSYLGGIPIGYDLVVCSADFTDSFTLYGFDETDLDFGIKDPLYGFMKIY